MEDQDIVMINEVPSTKDMHPSLILQHPHKSVFQQEALIFELLNDLSEWVSQVFLVSLVSYNHGTSSVCCNHLFHDSRKILDKLRVLVRIICRGICRSDFLMTEVQGLQRFRRLQGIDYVQEVGSQPVDQT